MKALYELFALPQDLLCRRIEKTEWLLASSVAYDVAAYLQTGRYQSNNPSIDQSWQPTRRIEMLIDLEVYLAAFSFFQTNRSSKILSSVESFTSDFSEITPITILKLEILLSFHRYPSSYRPMSFLWLWYQLSMCACCGACGEGTHLASSRLQNPGKSDLLLCKT